jgi:hypothetical protein
MGVNKLFTWLQQQQQQQSDPTVYLTTLFHTPHFLCGAENLQEIRCFYFMYSKVFFTV